MANKTRQQIGADIKGVDLTARDILHHINDSVANLNGGNSLPTADPASVGALFITGSDGMNLGDITGSGFAVLCVSQG
jgi:hypothetical protein